MDLTKCREWCNDHKKELIIGGVSALALGTLAFFGIRDYNSESLCESTLSLVTNPDTGFTHVQRSYIDTPPFEVNSHIRKLPEGMNASPIKQATALENGYILGPHETWVESYLKCNVA